MCSAGTLATVSIPLTGEIKLPSPLMRLGGVLLPWPMPVWSEMICSQMRDVTNQLANHWTGSEGKHGRLQIAGHHQSTTNTRDWLCERLSQFILLAGNQTQTPPQIRCGRELLTQQVMSFILENAVTVTHVCSCVCMCVCMTISNAGHLPVYWHLFFFNVPLSTTVGNSDVTLSVMVP